LEKVRIYELAKELNTTSKRLIEKLAEIDINVKNHMSYLEGHEIEALYKHIGVISHDGEKKGDEQKNVSSFTPQIKTEQKRSDKKDTPRIIRTTEITSHPSPSDGQKENNEAFKRNDNKYKDHDRKKNNSHQGAKNKNDYKAGKKYGGIKVSVASSGLRAGLVRETDSMIHQLLTKKPTVVKKEEDIKQIQDKDNKDLSGSKESQVVAAEVNPNTKPNVISEQKTETKTDIKTEFKNKEKHEKTDTKPKKDSVVKENKVDVKTEVNNEAKTEIKADVKTEVKAKEERKAEAKAEIKYEAKDEIKDEIKNKAELKSESKPADKQKSEAEVKSINTEVEVKNIQTEEPVVSKVKVSEVKPEENERGQEAEVLIKPDNVKLDSGSDIRNMPKDDKNKARHDDKNISHQDSNMQSVSSKKKTGYNKNINTGNEIKSVKTIIMAEIEEEEERIEGKRDYQNKDYDKNIKREQKRDVPKTKNASIKRKKLKAHNINLDTTVGVSKILQEDELFIDDLLETTKSVTRKAKKSSKVKKEKNNVNNNTEETKTAIENADIITIKIGDTITVKELAEKLKKTAADVIKKLMLMGTMVTVNQEIDFDTAAIVADEYGVKVEKEEVINEEDILFDEEEDDVTKLVPRPPVVVVMGHVDHGKTSLLDAIRKTNVIESEEGGITQHIGAYTVKINDRNITFLDTPGHEAFTAMRARGAQVTDIAVLVVAADDGVMPQTVEAINHAKAAGVTIMVAINKVDKPTANPERVKQQLTEYGLVPEEWGGNVTMVPVSAKKRENIDLLLEMILLTADIMELKANPDRLAKGTVIEAKLDRNKGPIATLLVQNGTLHVGDAILSGTIFGRIRAMTDDKGQNIKAAGPSTPVEVLGLPEVPESGEAFYVVKDEKLAKSLAEKRKQQQREEHLKSTSKVSLEDLFNQIQEGKIKELNVIVKADVQGSVEAMKQSLEKLSNDEVKINIIHGGVGAVTETDVKLAEVSNAIIVGFNVRPAPNVKEVAEEAGVDIKLYRVIYDAINDIEAAIKGMLEPTLKEVILGHAEIRQIYRASGIGTIGGAYVLDGKINRNSSVRVLRDNIVIHEGKLASLRRFKDDVREVAQGYECGLVIEKFNDIKEGDIIEAYAMEEVNKE